MNFSKITFTNKNTGQYKTAPTGFSWTMFFFGIIPALFREDWKWAGIGLLLNLLTFGCGTIILSFFYNKLHIKDLLKNGFLPSTEEECEYIIMKGIASKNEIDFLKKVN